MKRSVLKFPEAKARSKSKTTKPPSDEEASKYGTMTDTDSLEMMERVAKKLKERREQENTTGKQTPKGRPSLRREASPDDPIYKRGYVVGGKRLKDSSKTSTNLKSSPSTNPMQDAVDAYEQSIPRLRHGTENPEAKARSSSQTTKPPSDEEASKYGVMTDTDNLDMLDQAVAELEEEKKRENTTGKKTLRGKPSWITEASPDDPIYKRGYVVGGKRLKDSSKTSASRKPSPSTNPMQDAVDAYEAAIPGLRHGTETNNELEALASILPPHIPAIEIIKSFWISLRAEEMAKDQDKDYPDEQDYELADFDWFGRYNSHDFNIGLPDDPLIAEVIRLIKDRYQ